MGDARDPLHRLSYGRSDATLCSPDVSERGKGTRFLFLVAVGDFVYADSFCAFRACSNGSTFLSITSGVIVYWPGLGSSGN